MRDRFWVGLTGLAITLGVSALSAQVRAQVRAEHAAPAPLARAEIAATVERVAALAETRYVIPETGARYAAALRAHAAAGRYAALTDRRALAERLTADLQAVAPDGHLRVVLPTAAPSPGTSQTWRQEIAPGIIEARWLGGGTALIAFRSFSDRPDATTALKRFLADHRDARALIIDCRDNRGGSFDALGILGDALFDRERPLLAMDLAEPVTTRFGMPFPIGPELRPTAGPAGLTRVVHWAVPARAAAPLGKVPVYLLTSRRTFSAAEHLTMALKVTGRATLVGETTGGGNHFGGTEPVGAGLEMFVPAGRTSDLETGRDWEGVGVEPDIRVPADQALDAALRHMAKAAS